MSHKYYKNPTINIIQYQYKYEIRQIKYFQRQFRIQIHIMIKHKKSDNWIKDSEMQNPSSIEIQGLNLTFMNSKKDKSSTKSKRYQQKLSDRKMQDKSLNNIASYVNNYEQQIKTDRTTLLEKKKNYSAAIRQRNLLTKQFGASQVINQSKTENKKNSIHNHMSSIKENIEGPKIATNKKCNSKSSHKKMASNICTQYDDKHCMTVPSLEFDQIPHAQFNTPEQSSESSFDQNLTIVEFGLRNQQNHRNNSNLMKKKSQNYKESSIQQQHMKKDLQICSNVFYYIQNNKNHQNSKTISKNILQQNDLLERQNQTYKREIINIRKQKNQIQRQFNQAKGYIQQLKLKAEQLLEQSIGVSNLSFSCFNRNSQDITDSKQYQLNDVAMKKSINFEDQSSSHIVKLQFDQIIKNLQKQLKQATMLNSALQLKACMSEKKIAEQVNGYRKKMAKQVSIWRQKCTKLRADNMRLKSRHQATFSMQISKDEDQ